ncbi:MAG TPA: Ig-like domain-containing protein, partial [Beijerinckiaceae bacterium]
MAASVLSAGDIAIVRYQTDDAPSESFSFVLLSDIGSGTQIFFTDRNWNGTAFPAASAGEGTFTFTAGADMTAGTVITVTQAQLTAAGMNLSDSGDTIYAYQGTNANTPTRFLYAIDVADGNTTFNGSLANTGLTAGTTAVAVAVDNARWMGQSTQIQQTALTAISNNVQWAGTDSNDIGGTLYDDRSDTSLGGPITNPDMQLFAVMAGGGQSDAILRIDNEEASNVGTNLTRLFRDNPNFNHLTDLAFDVADGVWFAVDNDGTTVTRILKGSIADLVSGTSNPTISVIYDRPNDDANSNDDSFIDGIEIDTVNNKVYFIEGDIVVGHNLKAIGYNGGAVSDWGPLDLAVEPTVGFAGGIYDFALDVAHDTAYFTYVIVNTNNSTAKINYIAKVNSLSNPNPAVENYQIVQINGSDDPDGAGGNPANHFPESEGSLAGIDIDVANQVLYFTTQRLGVNGTAGIFKLDLASHNYTEIWQQQSNAATNTLQPFPTTQLNYIEVDTIGGKYYVTTIGNTDTAASHDGTATDEGGSRIFVGNLNAAPGTAPTFFATAFENTANGGPLGMEIDYAPTLTVSSAGSTYTEVAGLNSPAGATVDVATGPSVNDADQTVIKGATVAITDGFMSGNDTLTFTNSGGITGTYNSTTGVIAFTGDAGFSAYQTVLDSVRFTTSGDNPTNYGTANSRTISFTVTDGLLNSDPATATVAVTGINDGPDVNANGAGDSAAASINETNAALSASDTLTVTDPDSLQVTAAVTAVAATGPTNGIANGTLQGYMTVSSPVINIPTTGTTAQLTWTFNSNTEAFNFLGFGQSLQLDYTVTVTDTNNSNGGPGTLTDTQHVVVTIQGTNDAPVLTAGNTLAYTENDPATVISPAATITDVDSTDFNTGTLTVAFTANGTSRDQLSIRNQGTGLGQIGFDGTTVTYENVTIGTASGGVNGANLVITFTSAAATPTAVQALLDNITYASTSESPSTLARTVTYTLNDGDGTTNGGTNTGTATATINVEAINDPVGTASPGAATFSEDTPASIATAGGTALSIADLDATDSPNGVYEVILSGTHGVLTLTTIAGLTFTAGDGTTDATMTFHGTLSAINTAIATATYAPDANYNGSATITLQANDNFGGIIATGTDTDPNPPPGTQDSNTINVTVTAVNDQPSIANVSGSVSTNEQTAVLLDTDANVADIDLDPLNSGNGSYTGASLTIARQGAASAQDTFAFDTTGALFTVNGSNLESGGQVFATFSSLNGTLTINFTGSGTTATSALVDDVTRHVAYTNSSDAPPASVTLDYTFNDGSPGNGQGSGAAATATASKQVNITAINDEPSGADKTVTTNEDVAYTFTAADFGFTDVDGALLAVKIATLPLAGTLTNNNVAVNAGDSVTAAAINGGLLKFTPASNASGAGYASFTFQVQDNGGTANGGVDLDQSANTITVDVNAVNDAPAGTNNTKSINEDAPYTFAAADFGFSDAVEGNAFLAVKIGTITNGTLTNNGSPVSSGDTVPVADINAGQLVFTPAANVNGAGAASFTFQVQDDGGTANGGLDLDQSANTFAFDIAGVSDAPAGTDKTVTALENQDYSFTVADFGFSDANDSP